MDSNRLPVTWLSARFAANFSNYMEQLDYGPLTNLMPILSHLPLLKIRNGYEFDAFESGNDYSWCLQPYCHKADAVISYNPDTDNSYDESKKINQRIDYQYAKDIPAPLSYFDVPFTELGIMQAWLLENLTDFMPKGWHAQYSKKYYIFNPYYIDALFPEMLGERNSLADCLKLQRHRYRDEVIAIDVNFLLPSVAITGYEAVLKYSFWNDWIGMVKEEVQVVKDGNSVRFSEPEKEILVKYSSDIEF